MRPHLPERMRRSWDFFLPQVEKQRPLWRRFVHLGYAGGSVFRKLKESGALEGDDLTEEKILRLALKELKRN